MKSFVYGEHKLKHLEICWYYYYKLIFSHWEDFILSQRSKRGMIEIEIEIENHTRQDKKKMAWQ